MAENPAHRRTNTICRNARSCAADNAAVRTNFDRRADCQCSCHSAGKSGDHTAGIGRRHHSCAGVGMAFGICTFSGGVAGSVSALAQQYADRGMERTTAAAMDIRLCDGRHVVAAGAARLADALARPCRLVAVAA